MNELSVKEKAKRYDEAIEKFSVILNLNTVKKSGTIFADDVRKIFSELKETEDEKIGRVLVEWFKRYKEQDTCGSETFNGIPTDNIIAWLEKKAEQKPIIEMKSPEESLGVSSKEYNEIVNDCLYGEQKPSEKVVPKFKIGDWIVRSAEGFKHDTYLVKEVKDYYVCETLEDRRVTFTFNDVNSNFKLWDIHDVKNGDVLASDNGVIILVKESRDSSWGYRLSYHCAVLYDGKFESREFHVDPTKFFPAAKEQRNLLFAKMREAGYDFDFEKKELKKIDYNEELKKCKDNPLYFFDKYVKIKLKEHNPTWNEEDERMFKNTIALIKTLEDINKAPNGFGDVKLWLNSLKDRYSWKPSDEQIESIRLARAFVTDDFGEHPTLSEILVELEKQLKKLKECGYER